MYSPSNGPEYVLDGPLSPDPLRVSTFFPISSPHVRRFLRLLLMERRSALTIKSLMLVRVCFNVAPIFAFVSNGGGQLST